MALLRAAVQVVADRDELAAEVIASSRELDALVARATASTEPGSEAEEPALLQGWRRELVGDTLLAIARGDLVMRYDPERREVATERVPR